MLMREGAYIGINVIGQSVKYNGNIETFQNFQIVIILLMWIYVFNLGIGIVNMLPIKPLDGGLMFEEIVRHFTKRDTIIVKIVGGIMLIVLLFNLIGPIVVG